MDRIEHPTAVESRPSYEILPNSKKGYATGFNPVTKSKGTENLASQYNAIQETLMHTIEAANLTGNHNDDSLLTQAVKSFSSKKGYIKDSIYYGGQNSSDFVDNTVIWKGEARSSDNTTDIIADTYIRSSAIASPIINGVFYGFVGYDNKNNLKFEFTHILDGSALPSIVGAKRRVIGVVLDGAGGFIPFHFHLEKSGRAKITYLNQISEQSGTTANFTKKQFTAPPNCETFGIVYGRDDAGYRAIGYSYNGVDYIDICNIVYSVTQYWNFSFVLDENSEIFIKNSTGSNESVTGFITQGYYDERND